MTEGERLHAAAKIMYEQGYMHLGMRFDEATVSKPNEERYRALLNLAEILTEGRDD